MYISSPSASRMSFHTAFSSPASATAINHRSYFPNKSIADKYHSIKKEYPNKIKMKNLEQLQGS